MEPAELKLTKPLGGWPKTMVRIELATDISGEEAFREVAAASRRLRTGVVATHKELPLIAYPHETVDDIAHAYGRYVRMARQRGETPSGRWTPMRKAWVCGGVIAGHMTIPEAMTAFDLTAEELSAWVGMFSANGIEGLTIRHIVAGRP